MLERLQWSTDVIASFDASEQRIQLLSTPRRSMEFEIVVDGRDRQVAENALHAGQSGRWAVPVWMDSQSLQADLASGSSVIPVDTTTRDFYAGGMAVLMTGPRAFEVVDIDSLTGSTLTIASPTIASWPAGRTEIAPLRIARMADDLSLSRFTGDVSYGRMQFRLEGESAWPAASEVTLYLGFPILGTAPNWTDDIDQGYLRKLETLDTGTGEPFHDDEGGGAILQQSHRWLLDGRAQIDAFRRWLYARRGRLSAFWLPTFALDFVAVADIGSAATTIDVQNAGYTAAAARGIGRRDIRIELLSGTVYYRRITGSAEISSDVERLTISAALGAAVATSAIRSMSFMSLARLEADSIELAWARFDVVECQAVTRAPRNDL